MSALEPTTPLPVHEDVIRGALFALIVLPLGVVVWLLIWSIGFIASIVGFGVAIAALWLYRVGSRGPISRAGAFVVAAITVVTLLVAFFAGIVLDAVQAVAEQSGLGWGEVLAAPEFWSFFFGVLPAAFGDYAMTFLIAIAFGLLGCFTVLRSAFAQARQTQAPPEAVAVPSGIGDTLPSAAADAEAPAPDAAPAVDDEGAPEPR